MRLVVVFAVLAAAAGGQLARAGVARSKPVRLAPAGRVVLGGSFRVTRRGVAKIFAGGDYLVAGGRAPVVINDALGTRTPLHIDPGCAVVALGPPLVVMSCKTPPQYPSPLHLYSLADGTRQTVTPSPGLPCSEPSQISEPSPISCDVVAVGSSWIEWSTAGYHIPPSFYFQNIQTGELRDDPTNAATFPDLNSPSLAERTCPGVRLIHNNLDANPWGSLSYDGQFALVTVYRLVVPDQVVLERCGTHMRRPILGDGNLMASNASVIVWETSAVGARLSGLFLPSLQKFTMPLPSAVVAAERAGGETGSALTSDALYMNAGGKLWRTASPAALPRNVSGPRLTQSVTTLTCMRGKWLNAAKFSYEWWVNGRKEKATKSRLVLAKSPKRRRVNCSVIAFNHPGTTTASSAPLYLR